MAWSDTETCWSLESYESGVSRLLFPSDGQAACATWRIIDTVQVMRGLSLTGATAITNAINSATQTQALTQHAIAEKVGESGQYAVRKTVHQVTFLGVEKYDDSSDSSGSSES